jgi:hypothetical protein
MKFIVRTVYAVLRREAKRKTEPRAVKRLPLSLVNGETVYKLHHSSQAAPKPACSRRQSLLLGWMPEAFTD